MKTAGILPDDRFLSTGHVPAPSLSVFGYNRSQLIVCYPFSPYYLMPTYEYRCDSCDHDFEEFQYIKDAPLKKCPCCGKNKLRRLISGGAAIVFHGNGFYQTDYRSDSYRKAAKAESAPKSESAPSDSCKGCAAASECKAKS